MTVEDFAVVFFNKWYCESGCPLEIISNRDKLCVQVLEGTDEVDRDKA